MAMKAFNVVLEPPIGRRTKKRIWKDHINFKVLFKVGGFIIFWPFLALEIYDATNVSKTFCVRCRMWGVE